jgi:peptidyl-prolyl cis-trans isomerase B (cyclophilin B)
MKKLVYVLFLLISLSTLLSAEEHIPTANTNHPIIKIETNMGDIILKLYPEKAPHTVDNFLTYIKDDFYTNTIFHRVIDGFLIQGGGFVRGYKQKKTLQPIRNESENSLANKRGTVGMSLTTNPHSAASQFYINTTDNPELNYNKNRKYGFTTFGIVIEGMDTVDKIRKVNTSRRIIHSELYKREINLYNVPDEDIIITKIVILRDLLITLPAKKTTIPNTKIEIEAPTQSIEELVKKTEPLTPTPN